MLEPHPIPESCAGLLAACFLPGAGELFFSGEPISKVWANEAADTPRPTAAMRQAPTARFALKSFTFRFYRPAKNIQRPAAIRCEKKDLRLARRVPDHLTCRKPWANLFAFFRNPRGRPV